MSYSKIIIDTLRLPHWSVFLYLFFFQAEDGIRDLYVTGVQTCALPIYDVIFIRRMRAAAVAEPEMAGGKFEGFAGKNISWVRSEERRVGKECRSRWSAYH